MVDARVCLVLSRPTAEKERRAAGGRWKWVVGCWILRPWFLGWRATGQKRVPAPPGGRAKCQGPSAPAAPLGFGTSALSRRKPQLDNWQLDHRRLAGWGEGAGPAQGLQGKTKTKTQHWRRFFAEKTRTRGGRYCKTRDRTELIVGRYIVLDRQLIQPDKFHSNRNAAFRDY
jgi:hypothetical protein